ncbi:MAG: hypothetical protein VB050_13310 [Geobacteraceae bacterium]|nr:hypothetical protein [Geobacteraceae bacterium]
MHRYTELSENDLVRYLAKIRRISKMDNNDAIQELDEFIYNLCGLAASENSSQTSINNELPDYETESIENEIMYYRSSLEEYRNKLNTKTINIYDSQQLRSEISHLGQYWNKKALKKFGNTLTDLKREGNCLADKIEVDAYVKYIDDTDRSSIYNITSVNSILKTLNNAEACFRARELMTDELYDRIFSIKKECAWFRASKKIADAEVAKGGMNDKKYLKLIGEAEVMLKQDWSQIFPAMPVPRIESL